MKLSKQLFLGVSLCFFVLLVGIQWIYVTNARTYLQQQLSSHAQDAATSLGMTLPRALAAGDLIHAETQINAMFDRGYYRSIRVVSVKGDMLVNKSLPAAPPDVPVWFADRFRLDTPTAESLITDGWRQLGRVIVESHPNFAYLQLWNTTKDALLWLSVLYLLSLGLLYFFLRAIMGPLRQVEAAANAIAAREFVSIDALPHSPELRSVVLAMNSLSQKIRQAIDTEIAQAKKFQHEAYIDTLTGLDNRRGFEEQLRSYLEAAEAEHSGVLYMIELAGFKEFNETAGFERADELLRLIGQSLTEFLPTASNIIRARLSGATFVVQLFGVTRDHANTLGDILRHSLFLMLEEQNLMNAIQLKFGGAVYEAKPNQAHLLATADMAMLQAGEQHEDPILLLDCGNDTIDEQGSLYWKNMIAEALVQDRLTLVTQPVLALPGGAAMQQEIMARVKTSGGDLVVAAKFMPMASRHKLADKVDMKTIETALAAMRVRRELQGSVAINLSARTLASTGFMEWFAVTMNGAREEAKRLVFEFAEFAVVRNKEAVSRFAAVARSFGAGFAIDNFGLNPRAFEYLQTLKPAYLKLDRSYIADLASNREHQFFISTVVKIAQPLEIKVIALGVEKPDVLELLQRLGVNGYQGYVGGEMKQL